MADTIRITLKGHAASSEGLWLTSAGQASSLFSGCTAHSVRLEGPDSRGRSELLSLDIPPTALVEVELDGDLRFWTTADTLRERLADDTDDTHRSLPGETWSLPSQLSLPGARRGLFGKLALKALHWLDIKPDDALRDTLVERAQNRAIPQEGLFPVGADGSLGARLSAPIPDGERCLILLHGTASSTEGSFGKLWKEQSRQWKRLQAHFGDRIYALEHWTLTRSPLENARDVARLLPRRGQVSFLSHSRGGLVGELLCLDPANFGMDDALASLDATKRGRDPAWDRAVDVHKAALQTVVGELAARPHLTIGRFARVACPSRGTSLAGDKLDNWASLMVLAAIGWEMRQSGRRSLLAGAGTLARYGLDLLGETLAAVVASRRRPDQLPGLQAMMPGSALVGLLNGAPARGALFVVAGDCAPEEGEALSALRIWLADRYYERDHDLVVDTRSMFDGALRPALPSGARARIQFRSGADVNHFSYFRNDDSATAVVGALLQDPDSDRLFKDYQGDWPLDDSTGEAHRGLFGPRELAEPGDDRARGIVVIVPGLCGSQLLASGREIWASIPALALGGFTRHLQARDSRVTAGKPLDGTYLPLANSLRQRGYQVRMAGYDWRLSLHDAAPGLAGMLRDSIAQARRLNRPLHIVVHSMGGVLLRYTFATTDGLWSEWNGLPGDPRVLMLGTPNKGSHAITLLMTGRDRFFRQLALLDITRSQNELLGTAARFTGVMELLPWDPSGADSEIRLPATWSRFRAADGPGAQDRPEPDADALAASSRIWEVLARHDPLIDSPRLIYVAGQADQTPVVAQVRDNRFELLVTPEGDGRVPWSTGIPEACSLGGRSYFTRIEHGDLPSVTELHDAYLELLEKGRSNRLSSEPPVRRGAGTRPWRSDEADATLYPTAAELMAAATGGSLRSARKTVKSRYRSEVRVLHGDLLHAESAVMVGHSWGANALEFTEKLIDQALGGRMQRILDAGLHAGALGTHSLYCKQPGDRYTEGAIVIGIGRIGQLSGGQLSLAVSRALASYAVEQLNLARQQAPTASTPLALPVSTLLIGAGIGELTLADSVTAILRGHRDARLRLERAGLADMLRLTRLDIIEVLEDRAIHALRAAQDAVEVDPQLARAFYVETAIQPHQGARRRASAVSEDGQWHRIAISSIGGQDGTARLMFDVSGELARAERTYNAVPTEDIREFVQSLVGTTRDQEQVGRALFELIVPNWLKDLAPDQRRSQLIVDEASASYPWELLRDRASELDGDSGKPLSVRSGLIRQLATGEFRTNVRRPEGFRALVVGDPDRGDWARYLPPLPGAVEEARDAAQRLEAAGFKPALHLQSEARQILLDLYSEEWRVLHLSGHGIYAQDIPATGTTGPLHQGTGMVIGAGRLLRPAHIEQMRAVPDFVFLNCCNLGKIEDTAGQSLSGRPGSPAMAANLATALIRAGVRCVIAAGWEVQDDAALCFAGEFYEHFLKGTSFGESVLAARRKTYDKYADANTWGAYQCYGDPGFVLAHPYQATPVRRAAPDYGHLVAASEALCELERLTLSAHHAGGLGKVYTPQPVIRALQAVCERQGWIRRGDVLEGFARLCAEHTLHEQAIDYYRQALLAPDGSASRRAEEQLANMLTRHAATLITTDPTHATGLLDEADAVLGPSQGAGLASPERHSLRAAVIRRRIALQLHTEADPDTLLGLLRAMHDGYRQAETCALQRQDASAYPGLNANQSAALLILAGVPDGDRLRDAAHASLERIRSELRPEAQAQSFWDRAGHADFALADWLLQPPGSKAAAPRRKGGDGESPLAERYRALLDNGAGSPREQESVLSTLRTLQAIAAALPHPGLVPVAKGLADLLRQLKR
ncbi:CHAT domain-containing protein [Zoogloea sp.]|uniref:DUF7379 domain-containing protein n=1 Tax=Zoogloea sp. TaxID=49181 RepID=UPI002614D460|nr:CHAT domain-containing protein [Zoogloea sp.]MDD3354765.1 CHAT domain-containing protein [Zoogloea sp.]